MVPVSTGDLLGDQPLAPCAACRDRRRGRATRPARPCPHHPLRQEGADLAGRQHLLRQDPHVFGGFHPLAHRIPIARIRAAQGRRPVRAAFPRALDPHHDVGNSGPRHPQRIALARGDEGPRPLRARRALRPRQGEAVDQGRAAPQAGKSPPVRFRHPPPPRLPVAALVRGGGEGRLGSVLHRHLQRAARDGQ